MQGNTHHFEITFNNFTHTFQTIPPLGLFRTNQNMLQILQYKWYNL